MSAIDWTKGPSDAEITAELMGKVWGLHQLPLTHRQKLESLQQMIDTSTRYSARIALEMAMATHGSSR